MSKGKLKVTLSYKGKGKPFNPDYLCDNEKCREVVRGLAKDYQAELNRIEKALLEISGCCNISDMASEDEFVGFVCNIKDIIDKTLDNKGYNNETKM